MKIVYIDDDNNDLFLIKKILKKHIESSTVLYYRYLNDFLQSNQPYDVIITDLALPDAYGPEVLSRIRAVTGKPIIVLSGVGGRNVPDEITRAVKQAGATIFLSKNQNGLKVLPDALRQLA